MAQWEIVIGLETHTQLTTASKIFSGSSTAFGAAPNTQANVVDLAMPGSLPVMNKGAVERAVKINAGLGVKLFMNALARVFFEMRARQLDDLGRAIIERDGD